ncbi:MAG: protein tyrosine phosphatase family protein [Acidobacteriota bacterium]
MSRIPPFRLLSPTLQLRHLTKVGILAALALACFAQPPSQTQLPPADELLDTLEIRNSALPLPNVLTAGQPTEEQLRQAAELGFRTVINLRSEGEDLGFDEAAVATELGLEYLAIPISGAQDLTPKAVETLSEALANAPTQPVLLHCASSNRVGALLALKAQWLDGASTQEALILGREAGLTRLEPAVTEMLSQ